MPSIAVAGASGSIGQLIVQQVREQGAEPVELDRTHGVDLLTGQGLEASLDGVEAVIDASQVVSPMAEDPTTPILQAAQNLLEASRTQQVQRVVMLSINGIDDAGLQQFPFYRARYEQEQAVAASGLPHTVVRSAQWFEFGLNPAGVTEEENVVRSQDWAIQPLAARTAAAFLVEAALGRHGDGLVVVAGPERMRLPELTERTLRSRGDQRPVETVDAPLPEMASGALYAPEGAVLLGPDLQEWLDEQSGNAQSGNEQASDKQTNDAQTA